MDVMRGWVIQHPRFFFEKCGDNNPLKNMGEKTMEAIANWLADFDNLSKKSLNKAI